MAMTDVDKQILVEIAAMRTEVQKLATDVAVSKAHYKIVATELRTLTSKVDCMSTTVTLLKAAAPPKARQFARDGGLTAAGGGIAVVLQQVLEMIN